MKPVKPEAERVASCGCEIIYRCGKCHYSFQLGNSNTFFYCPHCGAKIDWGVVVEANKDFVSKFFAANYKKQQQMMQELDKINQSITDGKPREMLLLFK